jgi:hypothetical protein
LPNDRSLQTSLLREHQARGGKLANIWWAVRISIAISVIQVALFLALILTLPMFEPLEVLPDVFIGN